MRSVCFSVALCMALLAGASAQQATKRSPVPDAESVSAAKKLVGEVYRDRYVKAKTLELKLALVAKLLEDAQQTTDDPAGRYALGAVALDIAAGAGDWEAALAAIDLQDKSFDVDTISLIDDAREKIEDANKPPRDAKNAFFLVLSAIDQAIDKDRYDVGDRLALSASRLARRINEPQAARRYGDLVPDLQKIKRQYDELKSAIDVLAKDPADPAANLAVGSFRCFVQDRWEEGVPMLALGSDAALAKAALAELQQPTKTPEMMAVADQWWDLADARKSDARLLRRHAIDHYLRVLPKLDGLAKKKIEARVTTNEQWYSKDAVYGGPTFQAGEPPLPSLLSISEKFYENNGTQYAFQVPRPDGYIVIDLKRPTPISRIYIQNRPVHDRARGVGVFLSDSPDKRGVKVWTAQDNAAEWSIMMPKLFTARYITIARDPNINGGDGWLHLRKVKVFGPE